MKIRGIILLASMIATSAFSDTVESAKKSVNVGRIVQLQNLEEKQGLKVALVVEDLGGSTDVSPTQTAYLTLYVKGEMYSTDATFNLGSFVEVKKATRKASGMYELSAVAEQNGVPKDVKLTIDARKSTQDILAVSCDNFDCPESEKFKSTVEVSSK